MAERKRGKKGRKIGRNSNKCQEYRRKIGKPNGPGMDGCKSGKRKIRK